MKMSDVLGLSKSQQRQILSENRHPQYQAMVLSEKLKENKQNNHKEGK